MNKFFALVVALACMLFSLPTVAAEYSSNSDLPPEFIIDVTPSAAASGSGAAPLEARIEALERFAKDSSGWMRSSHSNQMTETRVREIVAEMIEAKLTIQNNAGQTRQQVVSYSGQGGFVLNPGETLYAINGIPVNQPSATVATQAVYSTPAVYRAPVRTRVVMRGRYSNSSTCRMVNGVMYCN